MKSKEFLKHRAYQLYKERHFTQRQVAASLDVSLGTANKLIHTANEDIEQSELTRLASVCKGKPFFSGENNHQLGGCDLCFWGLIKEPEDRYGRRTICYDYESDIIDAIESSHAVALIKSRSIGTTQLILIYILYRTLAKQDKGNYFIVTGNDFEASCGLMRRLRVILAKHWLEMWQMFYYNEIATYLQGYTRRILEML